MSLCIPVYFKDSYPLTILYIHRIDNKSLVRKALSGKLQGKIYFGRRSKWTDSVQQNRRRIGIANWKKKLIANINGQRRLKNWKKKSEETSKLPDLITKPYWNTNRANCTPSWTDWKT